MQKKIHLIIYKDIWIWKGFFAVIDAGLGQMPFTLGFPKEYISIGTWNMSQHRRGFSRTEHMKFDKSGMIQTIGVEWYCYYR